MPGDNFLSIDPGSKRTGWCVSTYSKYVSSGVIKDGYVEKFKEIERICNAYSPRSLIIEDQYFGPKSNQTTLRVLTRSTGAIECAYAVCSENGEETIIRVAPKTWIAAILGKKLDRKRVKEYARTRCVSEGIDAAPDEADAICMSIWYRNIGRFS